MKRNAIPGNPIIEDTFVPELEAEEARLGRLLQTAKDEAVQRILEAERAAEALLADARESRIAQMAETRRRRSLANSEARLAEANELRSAAERFIRVSRSRIPQATDKLVELVCGGQDLP